MKSDYEMKNNCHNSFPSLYSAAILDLTLDYTENDYERIKESKILEDLEYCSNRKNVSLESNYDIYKIWNVKALPPISQLPLCLAYYNLVHSELREIATVAAKYDMFEDSKYEVPIPNIEEKDFLVKYDKMLNELCSKQLSFTEDSEDGINEDCYCTSVAFSYKVIKYTARYSHSYLSLIIPLKYILEGVYK